MLVKSLVYLLLAVGLAAAQEEALGPNGQPRPEPYSFSYSADASGALSSHQESGDGSGRITGVYTITGPDGRQRRVEYVADADGYRATVKTNEIGTKPEDSGAAHWIVEQPSEGQLIASNNANALNPNAQRPAAGQQQQTGSGSSGNGIQQVPEPSSGSGSSRLPGAGGQQDVQQEQIASANNPSGVAAQLAEAQQTLINLDDIPDSPPHELQQQVLVQQSQQPAFLPGAPLPQANFQPIQPQQPVQFVGQQPQQIGAGGRLFRGPNNGPVFVQQLAQEQIGGNQPLRGPIGAGPIGSGQISFQQVVQEGQQQIGGNQPLRGPIGAGPAISIQQVVQEQQAGEPLQPLFFQQPQINALPIPVPSFAARQPSAPIVPAVQQVQQVQQEVVEQQQQQQPEPQQLPEVPTLGGPTSNLVQSQSSSQDGGNQGQSNGQNLITVGQQQVELSNGPRPSNGPIFVNEASFGPKPPQDILQIVQQEEQQRPQGPAPVPQLLPELPGQQQTIIGQLPEPQFRPQEPQVPLRVVQQLALPQPVEIVGQGAPLPALSLQGPTKGGSQLNGAAKGQLVPGGGIRGQQQQVFLSQQPQLVAQFVGPQQQQQQQQLQFIQQSVGPQLIPLPLEPEIQPPSFNFERIQPVRRPQIAGQQPARGSLLVPVPQVLQQSPQPVLVQQDGGNFKGQTTFQQVGVKGAGRAPAQTSSGSSQQEQGPDAAPSGASNNAGKGQGNGNGNGNDITGSGNNAGNSNSNKVELVNLGQDENKPGNENTNQDSQAQQAPAKGGQDSDSAGDSANNGGDSQGSGDGQSAGNASGAAEGNGANAGSSGSSDKAEQNQQSSGSAQQAGNAADAQQESGQEGDSQQENSSGAAEQANQQPAAAPVTTTTTTTTTTPAPRPVGRLVFGKTRFGSATGGLKIGTKGGPQLRLAPQPQVQVVAPQQIPLLNAGQSSQFISFGTRLGAKGSQ